MARHLPELQLPERWLPEAFRAQYLRRVRVRPTREGWWSLLMLLGLTLAAFNTGNNLLYLMLSMTLSLLVIQNVVAEWNMRGVAVRRALPEEAFAFEGAAGRFILENRRRLGPSYDLLVEELDGGEARALIGLVPATERVEASAAWTFARRGRAPLGRVRLSSSFPFGLFLRYRDFDLGGELLVYPARRRGTSARGAGARGASQIDRRRKGGEADFMGLRPYAPGDPLRRLHAPTSARAGRPMVVERAVERATEVILRLEGRPGRLEEELAGASGLATRAFSLGHAVGLELPQRRIPPLTGPQQRRRILSALALHEALHEAPPSPPSEGER